MEVPAAIRALAQGPRSKTRVAMSSRKVLPAVSMIPPKTERQRSIRKVIWARSAGLIMGWGRWAPLQELLGGTSFGLRHRVFDGIGDPAKPLPGVEPGSVAIAPKGLDGVVADPG